MIVFESQKVTKSGDTPDATADCGRRQSSTASRMLNMKVFKSNKIKNMQHFNVI